jgi:hypothetical protein
MTFEEYIRICRFCLFAVMHDQKTPGDVLNVPVDPLDDVAAAAVRCGVYTFIVKTVLRTGIHRLWRREDKEMWHGRKV